LRKPPEAFRMAGSSNGMINPVAVAIAALNVNDNVVGFVKLAAVAVTPARLVVYAGIPLRDTG
jgi:hypothetical protein